MDRPALVDGGDNFDQCEKLFLEELEIKNLAYHTRRWHHENLSAVKKALQALELPTEPTSITKQSVKDCILYWKRERNLSPTTINHHIRSLKQFFLFLNKEGMVNSLPAKDFDKLKSPKTISQASAR